MWTLCSPVIRKKLIHDTRMFLHAVHASSHRSTRVTIQSNDSDIVILRTALFPQLDLEELYVTFGRDKSYQDSQAKCIFNCFSCYTRQLLVFMFDRCLFRYYIT